MTVSNDVTHLSSGAQMPVGCGDSVSPTVCVAVSDCLSLSTHVCLDLKGHLAPFLGWLAGPETIERQDGQVQR